MSIKGAIRAAPRPRSSYQRRPATSQLFARNRSSTTASRTIGYDEARERDRPIGEERQRRWSSGHTTRLNAAHWSGVSGNPINADLSSFQQTLRQRTEFEVANNSLIRGMLNTYALALLGPEGPTLQVLSADNDYNQAREAVWNNWEKQAGTNQQLGLIDIMRMWVFSLFSGGEFVDQFVSLPDAEGPCKTRLLPVHSHRLMTPPEFLGDHSVAMGVRRDLQNRRPLYYYVSQPYIMGSFEVYTGEFLEVPYRDLLHGFLMEEEDQVRGVPWLAPCLDTIGEIRDYKDVTLDAAEAAAKWGVFLYTDSTELPPAAYQAYNESWTFERNQVRTVMPGYKPSMVQPQQPPANWEMYYHSLIRELGSCVSMPLMMLLLDSSKHNYSSARFDGQMFWKGITYTQGFFSRQLDRIEAEVAREASLAGMAGDPDGLPRCPSGPIARRWNWPKAPHVDPTKEAMAVRMRLQNGTSSFTEECAAEGKDPNHVIAQRKVDAEKLTKADLPTIPGIPDPNLSGAAGTQGIGSSGAVKGIPGATGNPAKQSGMNVGSPKTRSNSDLLDRITEACDDGWAKPHNDTALVEIRELLSTRNGDRD